jgi:flagellar motor switch protein FliG
MMVAQREQLRMAAVLFARLDREQADALLARMSPGEARRVRQAVVELNGVSEDEEEDALAALARGRGASAARFGSSPNLDAAGFDLEERIAHRLGSFVRDEASFGDALTIANDASTHDDDSPNEEAPFRFLHEAQMDELAARLGREHPQAIAVVLAYLPPSRAAEALGALAEPVQVEVMRRLAVMEPTDAVVVREIEDALRRWIAPAVESGKPSVGMTAAQRILTAASGATQRNVLAALVHRDAELARRLGHRDAAPMKHVVEPSHRAVKGPSKVVIPPPGQFSDLERLSARQLAALWSGIDREIVVLALAAASPAFVDRVLHAVDDSLADAICQSLDELGPVSLSDLDVAQAEVVAAWHAMQSIMEGGDV